MAGHPSGGADSRLAADDAAGDAPPACRASHDPAGMEASHGSAHHAPRRHASATTARPRPALDAIDLDIEAGRITAIMGPSGGGKSTLLNLIGGLDRPTPGEIEVDGVRVDRLSETGAARFRRANVGFVFQFFHLLDDLSVADNIGVAGDPRRPLPRRGATRGPTSCSPSSGLARQGAAVPGDPQRRRAPARRDRPGDRQPTGRPARRRADRRARPTQRRDRAGAPRGPQPARPDDPAGDPRRATRRAGARTASSGSSTASIAGDEPTADGGVMGAVAAKTVADLRRRRLQTVVLALVLFLATGAATLALSILVETHEPFDHAFAAANGAHLVIDYDAAMSMRAALAATAHARGVTASAGPWPVGAWHRSGSRRTAG